MTEEYERTHLWKSTLAKQKKDDDEGARDRLRGAYLKFRDRVSHLVAAIGSELPGLTVHDITHLDALWRVASEIAGPKYVLTPAEAFVLGGAILLHDSAHAIAAFPGGKAEIKQTQHWRDLIAHRYNRQEPANGSDDERGALFHVLRHLHATQAANLPNVSWKAPGDATPLFLLEDTELRQTYGELIGRIAESHHWPAHRVATEFSTVTHTPPSYLPSEWTVDAMKVAFLLRTADAAHIDNARAPWFLFALQKPEGISKQHWHFQSKLGQPLSNKHGELQISSASSFGADEREAWWLAYDTVQMIDRELRDAHGLMRDHGRDVFQSTSVLGAASPESFARYVKPKEWEPVDVAPKIGNVSKIIEMLGGEKLYGDHPEYALRELLQNAIDAVHAKRALGGLGPEDGEIVVALDKIDDDNYRLSVTDNGIGMSKYVMTNVLLDFGNSLWTSDAMRDQLPGLATSQFKSAGQFGIGFFSVFMLGQTVSVTSQRWTNNSVQYGSANELTFQHGLSSRPTLRGLASAQAESGTSVVVIAGKPQLIDRFLARDGVIKPATVPPLDQIDILRGKLRAWLAYLVPMSDVRILMSVGSAYINVVEPNDWLTISQESLLDRILRGDQWSRIAANSYFFEEPTGVTIGRVGLGGWARLLHTHEGITCTMSAGLSGLIRADKPSNAARTEASSPYSLEAWQRWAKLVWEAEGDALLGNQILHLHLLLPDLDVAIYRSYRDEDEQDDDEYFTASEVAISFKNDSEILFVGQPIEYHRDDNVSEKLFDDQLMINANVVCIPRRYHTPGAWTHLNLAEIDYKDRLCVALKTVWPNVSESNERREVGEVEGTSITRLVTVLRRVNGANN